MYPIKFENLYYEKVWGGREFEKFRTNLPEGNIGERWDIACHPNGIGVVANGEFKGMTFNELIEKHKDEIFGKSLINEEFLLLVKLINSDENLSVQIHPNDEYAKRVENSYGKTEAWYVVDAKDDAEFFSIITCVEGKGTINYKNKTEIIAKGDSILIPVQLGEYEIKGEVEILISKPVI